MKKITLVIVMVLVLLFDAYCSYNFGFTSGYKIGYNDGYEIGYAAGNESGYIYGNQTGFTQGYLIGFSRGNETGYLAGYLNGNETGYSLGYRAGFRDGEQTGYEQGFSAGYRLGYSNGFESGNETGFNLGYKFGYGEGYLQGVIDGAGRGFTIRDPTYDETIRFVNIDQTDKNEYVEGVYTCINFAADFKMNAFNAGYRCGLVYVEFAQGAHALVCFNTTDKGLIFVEPQTDDIMRVEVGIRYWHDNGYPCPWNDTIIRYIIIW